MNVRVIMHPPTVSYSELKIGSVYGHNGEVYYKTENGQPDFVLKDEFLFASSQPVPRGDVHVEYFNRMQVLLDS